MRRLNNAIGIIVAIVDLRGGDGYSKAQIIDDVNAYVRASNSFLEEDRAAADQIQAVFILSADPLDDTSM